MKLQVLKIATIATLCLCGERSGRAQGAFVDLNFENPNLPLIRDVEGKTPTAGALPGWTAYIEMTQQDRIWYNARAIDEASITIEGPGTDLVPVDTTPPVLGNYSVVLKISSPFALFNRGIPSIAQSGQVPANAKSLVFVTGMSFDANLTTTFAGHDITMYQTGATPNYTVWSGDVSAYAGTVGELRFSGTGLLDGIHFSSLAVPEPNVFAFSALGVLLLGGRCCCGKLYRRRRQNNC